jgi:hypothetical protein
MTVGPADEHPHDPTGAGFSDAVTFSFGDPAADVFGVARVAQLEAATSELAILFVDREPIAATAGVRASVEEPLTRWTVGFENDDDTAGFELEFRALSAPAALPPASPAARAGGFEGYDQLCRVTGTVTAAGAQRSIACLGQRGHSWGTPAWDRIERARTLSAWLDEGLGLSLTAVRDSAAEAHGGEAIAAFMWQPADAGELAAAVAIADPRLSTTYDEGGRQRSAGLELYVNEDDGYARRAAGEVACGTTLDLGELRLDCSFFTWRMDGHEGVGRYDIVRRNQTEPAV